MPLGRRSRARSSRGHVRVDQGQDWINRLIAAGTVVLLIITVVVMVDRFVLPMFDSDETSWENRTWLEFEWTRQPINQSAVSQLADRLDSNNITRIYLEANAWRADGTLIEGEYAAEFADSLRDESSSIDVLLWLRMSGEEIAQDDRRTAVTELAARAVRQWGFDGVQLNGRAVYKDSDSYVQLLRALRSAIGEDAILSVTVPPDRIPMDPDVPVGTTLDADLTWDVDYKQRVGLLEVDEMVIMAHASGLQDSAQYEVWVAYQVESYVDALAELEQVVDFVVALPTYDAGPEFDPAVETLPAAVAGVRDGLRLIGDAQDSVRGVGLYEYKTTDSLEWMAYREAWLEN